jgi:hypothetical protein
MASVSELEALVAERIRLLEEAEAALAEAEAALAQARSRAPVVGDFVRSTLTNFFGCVTKVIPRPSGRPWVEITPYLAPGLPGHSTLDLYDAWEIIDDPSGSTEGAEEPSAAEIVAKLTEVIVSYDVIAPGKRDA